MPLQVLSYNLVITKETINLKYMGGLESFKADFSDYASFPIEEDNELISFGFMNNEFEDLLNKLSKSFHFNNKTNTSLDFTILEKYGTKNRLINGIRFNRVHIWHSTTSSENKRILKNREEMTMDEMSELYTKYGFQALGSFDAKNL